MSELFIPIPLFLKDGEIKTIGHKQYIIRYNNCGNNFVSYNQSD